MISTNKKYYILLILYALYSVCNFQIANCESLTDVDPSTLSKIDKSLGWIFIISTTIFCGYLLFKGIYPTDSTETSIVQALPLTSIKDIQATEDKTHIDEEETNKNTIPKDSEYLKLLQDLTKYIN